MLRKLLLVFLCAYTLFSVSACGKTGPDLRLVSDLVCLLFTGENDAYEVTVSAGKREVPFLADGKVGEIYPLFSVRITPKFAFSEGEDFSVSVTLDGQTYAGKARFSPAASYLSADLSVSTVSADCFLVSVYRNGESQSVEVRRIPSAVTEKTAISAAEEALQSDLAPHHNKGKFAGEIHVRLTAVKNTAYWFVCFVPENGKEALSALIDGKTGAVLAVNRGGKKT